MFCSFNGNYFSTRGQSSQVITVLACSWKGFINLLSGLRYSLNELKFLHMKFCLPESLPVRIGFPAFPLQRHSKISENHLRTIDPLWRSNSRFQQLRVTSVWFRFFRLLSEGFLGFCRGCKCEPVRSMQCAADQYENRSGSKCSSVGPVCGSFPYNPSI